MLTRLVGYQPYGAWTRVLAFGVVGRQHSIALWLARRADPEQLQIFGTLVYKIAIERLPIRLRGWCYPLGDAVPLQLWHRVDADRDVLVEALGGTGAKVMQLGLVL